jgi:taurine dioxygenase
VLAAVNRGKAYAFTAEQLHSDLSFMPAPPAHAILAAQVLPETGGDTMFASQYFAYETLSQCMKAPPPGATSVAPRNEAGRLLRD